MTHDITHDSAAARLTRLGYPGWSHCGRCGFPWSVVTGHTTDYTDLNGCFPLCETCWQVLTPVKRIPYYDDLIDDWASQGADTQLLELDRALIRVAVMLGG